MPSQTSAWTENDVLETLRYRTLAAMYARKSVEFAEASRLYLGFRGGRQSASITVDVILQTINRQADQELELLRVIEYASCNGINFSDVMFPEPLVMEVPLSDRPLSDSFCRPDKPCREEPEIYYRFGEERDELPIQEPSGLLQ